MMQEYKKDELIRTVAANSREALLKDVSENADRFVIGTIPGRGEVVEINGLEFVVLAKSDRKGTLHLEIRKPKVKDE